LGVSVGLFSHLNETIDHSGSFTLHLLDQARAHYAELFAGTNQVEEAAINGVPFALKGRALLLENLPYLHCQLKQSHRHGDHTFHVGEITDSRPLPPAWQPLVTAQDELDYQQTLFQKS
jgi:flavin reductase (DIM6/NTAB) family NADH-FMN oxidoreductase RutF